MSDMLFDLLNYCPLETWRKLSVEIQQQFVAECFRRRK